MNSTASSRAGSPRASSTKPSVRGIVVAVIGGALTVTAAVGIVLYLSWKRRNDTNDRMNQEVASIAALHDLETGILEQGTAIAGYDAVHPDVSDQTFNDAQAHAESALTTLRADAAAHQPGEVPGIDQLKTQYEAVDSQEEEVLKALDGNIAEAGVLATSPIDLQIAEPDLRATVDIAIADSGDQLTTEERADHAAQRAALWLFIGMIGLSNDV
jgi:hypothetical protein